MARRPLIISDHDSRWPQRFHEVATMLRTKLQGDALRIDHIGSTAVPGLAAKDLIDVQITVETLAAADAWPDELLPGVARRGENTFDHIPPGLSNDPTSWEKRYWSNSRDLHVHVRAAGHPNQRYPLLFRDYLRADPRAAAAYGLVKRALASVVPDDWDAYYEVKDPVCDVIVAGAEQWAARLGWTAPPSDA